VSSSGAGAYEAALATTEDGFVTAWYDIRDGNGEIYIRRLNADGEPIGDERRLTSGPEDSYEPSVEVVGDAVVVAWYDKSGDRLVPKLGVWDLDGRNRWVQVIADTGRNPVLSVLPDDVFCAWIAPGPDGREWVWAGWWKLFGTAGVQRPLAPAGKTTWNVNALATAVGQAWVVFDATAGTKADELFLVSVDQDRIEVRRITADDGIASKYPDVAGVNPVAVTWFDERDGNEEVYLFVGPATDLASAIDARARRVTSTPGASIGAYLDWSGEADAAARRVGLAWSDDTGGQHEVYFQSFARDGSPLGAAQRVTRTPTSSLVPAIRPWRDGFALAWNEFRPGPEAHAGTSEIAFTIVK
jgi:hypothetical protein